MLDLQIVSPPIQISSSMPEVDGIWKEADHLFGLEILAKFSPNLQKILEKKNQIKIKYHPRIKNIFLFLVFFLCLINHQTFF